jgi:hypothetical protein
MNDESGSNSLYSRLRVSLASHIHHSFSRHPNKSLLKQFCTLTGLSSTFALGMLWRVMAPGFFTFGSE